MLPIIAAVGGMIFPAGIHYMLNAGTSAQSGFGIPMATDIAFALGILSLVGRSVPVSLKIFLTALAIIDDLGAITVIALFYTEGFSFQYFGASLFIFLMLFIAGKKGVSNLAFYIIGGVVMWYLMLKSGVHATISGVMLAFAIPFQKDNTKSPSVRLQHFLHPLVAFIILPIFAFTNTSIALPRELGKNLFMNNSLGIFFGLVMGKIIGIFGLSYLAVKTRMAVLSEDLNWKHIFGVSILGGIGFTMSIFITNLAFDDSAMIVASKLSILLASFVAAIFGLIYLKRIKP